MCYVSRHYSDPKIPSIPGLEKFPGMVMHSHQYRSPGNFTGKRVVLIGAAASGIDICLDLCGDAKILYLSHHGNRLSSELPGNIEQHYDVIEVEDDGAVVFQDGQRRKADVIMFCTGYLFSFPFLSEKCGITVVDNRVTHLYKHLFNIKYPTMSFIGLPIRITPFPQFSLQARLIAAVLSQKTLLPSTNDMLKDEEEDYQDKMLKGIKHHYAHYLGPTQWQYNSEMSKLAKCEPIDQVVEDLYEHCAYYRTNDVMNYKKMEYKATSDSTFEVLK